MTLAEAFEIPVPAAKDLPKPLVYSEFSPTAIALVAVNVSSNEFDLVQGDVDQSSSGGLAILLLPDSRRKGQLSTADDAISQGLQPSLRVHVGEQG